MRFRKRHKLRRINPNMNHYMVFISRRSGDYLMWDHPPIGVYPADSPEEACHAAAQESGRMGTFFAIPGFPWGVEMEDKKVRSLGSKESARDRMDRILSRLEADDPGSTRGLLAHGLASDDTEQE